MTEALAGEKERTGAKLRFQVSLGNATIALHGHGAPETAAAFDRARKLATDLEDVGQRLSAIYGIWAGHYVRGELAAMREQANAFLLECAGRPESGEACVAHRIQGVTHWFAGDFKAARESLERSLSIFDPERDRDLALRFGQDIGVSAMAYSALVLWALGEFNLARRRSLDLMERTSQNSHAATSAYGNMHLALIEMQARNPERAAPFVRAVVDVSRARQMPMFTVISFVMEGWVDWHAGRLKDGLSKLREGHTSYKEGHILVFDPLIATELARDEAAYGEIDAALSTLDGALALSERTGQRWNDAEFASHARRDPLRAKPLGPRSRRRRLPRRHRHRALARSPQLRTARRARARKTLPRDRPRRRCARRARPPARRLCADAGISGDC